jgi:hypothetical protein
MATTRDLILTEFEDYYYSDIYVDLINVYQFSDFALLSCLVQWPNGRIQVEMTFHVRRFQNGKPAKILPTSSWEEASNIKGPT